MIYSRSNNPSSAERVATQTHINLAIYFTMDYYDSLLKLTYSHSFTFLHTNTKIKIVLKEERTKIVESNKAQNLK